MTDEHYLWRAEVQAVPVGFVTIASVGGWELALTGGPIRMLLDVPPSAEPTVMIKSSNGEPNVRCLTYDGREIHSCVIPSATTSFDGLRERAAGARNHSEELRERTY